MTHVAQEFEAGGFWSCRGVNTWVLVAVTLGFGIALGADILYEIISDDEFPVSLAAAGLFSTVCIVLLWVCVTYAAVAAVVALIVALFVDGVAYSVSLALLVTGLTAQAATRTFRLSTLAAMVLWAGLMGLSMEDPLTGTLTFLGVTVLLLGAYGIGGAFRHVTTARLQSRRDLQEAENRHREAVTAERRAIARDLHDIVAHDITLIAMQSRAAQLKGTLGAYEQAIQAIGDSSRVALKDLRRMLALLQEDDDDTAGGSEDELSIATGCDVFAQRLRLLGFRVSVEVEGDLQAVSPSVSSALYRILQECTTNIAKYAAGGAQCTIALRVEDDCVHLQVANAVAGAQQEGESWSSSGAGLQGVRDRAGAFGGTVSAGMDDQGRWLVDVRNMRRA
ncbi:sensor histidine kinase [Nesterenkonia flava]|uniref:histidine kinase n=1 Tax=Nesterenkonia flava TaxID=469799 RepID=A0ABU1FQV0_9MICC|nr:histidine kinase [Nesterenkonia flava]MDR5711024.1 histidine kinase [Nesterenkonia flava]